MPGLPAYVETRGNPALRQPLALHDTMLYAFLLHTEMAPLTELCEMTFNRPSARAVEYVPLGPLVFAECADTARVQSLDPLHAQWGWGAERDFSFWVPLVERRSGDLRWFMPYMFVDSGAACIGGRETYGFIKQTATLTLRPSRDDPAELAVDTLLVEHAGSGAHAAVSRLYTIRRMGGAFEGLEATWDSVEAAARGLADAESLVDLVEALAKMVWYGTGTVLSLFRGLLERSVPMVFLKQFRDAAHAALASQQQIVEAPSVMTAWHGGGLLPPYELVIRPCDSHPLIHDLGLNVDHQAPNGDLIIRPRLAFWHRIDFRFGPGTVVWRAG